MPNRRDRSLRILCLARSAKRLSALEAAVRSSGYSALIAATSEEAVAVCVAQVVVATVVDAESLRGQEWTVVKTLKAIRPRAPLILLEERQSNRGSGLPDGVDAVASISSPVELFNTIDELVKRTESQGNAPVEDRRFIGRQFGSKRDCKIRSPIGANRRKTP